jgi:hypothetical protein
MRRTAMMILMTLLGVTGAQADRYTIEAQYRGIVRKSFPGVGTAGLEFVKGTDGAFHARGQGRVVHPQDKSKVFQLGLDMRFRVKGDAIEYVATKNSCAKGSEELQSTMERVLPFVHLVRELPRPAGNRRSVTTPHGNFTLVYGGAGPKLEITVQQGATQVGKFFLTDGAPGAVRLERFRIPGKDSVALQFTVASANAAVMD